MKFDFADPPLWGVKGRGNSPCDFSQHRLSHGQWCLRSCPAGRESPVTGWCHSFPIFFKGGFPKIAAWSYHGTTLPWLLRLDFSVPFKWCFKRLIWGYLPNINWCRILSIAISTDAGKPQSKQETEGLRIRLPTLLKFNQWIPKKMPSWRPETHVPKAHHFWYHTSGQISGVDK